MGIVLTTLAPLLLHRRIHQQHDVSSVRRKLFTKHSRYNHPPPSLRQDSAHEERRITPREQPKIMRHSPRHTSEDIAPPIQDPLERVANQAEENILDFFQGETRALQDGIPLGIMSGETNLDKDGYKSILAQRLAKRIVACRDNQDTNDMDDTNCSLRVVFIGGGQTTGRDIFHNQTYPFQVEERLRGMAESAGLRLEVRNHAMDSDLSKEGPQSAHMCIQNLVGSNVDVVGWDLEANMQAQPHAQFEAFVRWTLATAKPALFLVNRGGPHGRSRRGTVRLVVPLSEAHHANIYEDDPDNLPEPQQEPYGNSSHFDELWNNHRNFFWNKIFETYSPYVDFAPIDPQGSIWHLDHLREFSNKAFDGRSCKRFDV